MQTTHDQKLLLPIMLKPRPAEMVLAHQQRVAEENFVSLRRLHTLMRARIAEKGASLAPEKQVERLLESLGNPVYQTASPPLGVLLPNDGSSIRFKQVCPQCLRNDITITSLMEQAEYAICFTHSVAHVTHCPECRQPLQWGRGSYFHCQCHFDLRLAPTVAVDEICAVLFDACASNVEPDQQSAMFPNSGALEIRARLATSLQYLVLGLEMAQPEILGFQESGVSPWARAWMVVAKQVMPLNSMFSDVVHKIEARLIYANGMPQWAITMGQERRLALTWHYLASLAQIASDHAVRFDPETRSEEISERYGIPIEHVIATQVLSCVSLSLHLRSALFEELQTLKWKNSPGSPLNTQRVRAICKLASDLRSIHNQEWIDSTVFCTTNQLLSFVATGVIFPWAQAPVQAWHVFATEVDEVVAALNLRAWPTSFAEDDDPGFVLNFDSIFSEHADPGDWLDASDEQIRSRIELLVPATDYGDLRGVRYFHDVDVTVPYGFCYFLKHPGIKTYASEIDPKLSRSVLESESRATLVDALTSACLLAKTNFWGLSGWKSVSALASRALLTKYPANQVALPSSLYADKANRLIEPGKRWVHKSFRSALTKYAEMTS